jgi:hypothetical protein
MPTECLTVRVTAGDIAKGQLHKWLCCPLALALQRTTGQGDAGVGSYGATVGSGKTVRVYELSDPAQRFVFRFDTGQPVQPATFRLTRTVHP